MSIDNIQTTDSLKQIFNLPENNSDEPIIDSTALTITDGNTSILNLEGVEEEKIVDVQLQDLTVKANGMLDIAKFRMETSPDSETIDAVSKLLKSTADVLSELNKSLLLSKEYRLKRELEMMKINAKKELAMLSGKTKQVPNISGNNNSITVQNNVVQFSQEDIIKSLLKAKCEEKAINVESIDIK